MSNEIMETLETGVVNYDHATPLTNKKLACHTRAIEKLMTATKRNMFEISARLLVIRNEKLFVDDGFKDVFDYAEKLFGYKKNMVYKLTTAAEKFIEQSPEGKGYVSILIHDNADYTVSQLIELNGIEPETAVKLDKQEIISPDMTTKEIREVVKAYKNGEIDDDGNFIEHDDADDSGEGEGDSEKVDETAALIIKATENITKILEDARIIQNSVTVAKLQEMKRFLSEITL